MRKVYTQKTPSGLYAKVDSAQRSFVGPGARGRRALTARRAPDAPP
jgi:hypothetical protein